MIYKGAHMSEYLLAAGFALLFPRQFLPIVDRLYAAITEQGLKAICQVFTLFLMI